MKKLLLRLVTVAALLLPLCFANAQSWDAHKKVVLQAFWWDYWNENYPNSYANYLTELAPRLREMDINAIWVPPFYKNTGTNSVGYSPFDHYDLGDKYQKGSVTTRFGTKDEVLRMIAVMHANGIEVIADAVLNHVDGANVKDPEAPQNQWKNFRYVCYKTPETTGSDADYLAREGRWPKNWPNFHPTTYGHNTEDGDWCASWWGPDICYESGAFGQSSNATYNPEQTTNYMRNNAREWIMWFKKQTGVDGFRWDAVKHYPEYVQQDLSYNVKYVLPAWAQGGEAMFNVGEFIGGKTDIDSYTSRVTYENSGSEFLMGGFDFPLRSSIKSVVDGGGYGNLSEVVNNQLNSRYADYANQRVHRSVNYVNSHDTFRPTFDDDGNYSGWDTTNETGGHINPFDNRLAMAYAIAAALDGNLCLYMEDLFNLSNFNRWTHDPKSETELPVRSAIANIVWCHQNLDFKYGEYKVRWQSEDLLVIERSGRAIIAITDNGASTQGEWIDTDFNNIELKDYSGGISGTSKAYSDNRFYASAPAADGSGYGYAIWAPVKADSEFTYAPYRDNTTTQEWEMADDLGDSNCKSLGQGGALPANSTNQRLVGKIYAEKGKAVTVNLYLESEDYDVVLALYDLDGNLLAKESGATDVQVSYTPESTGWIAMKIWNAAADNAGQKAWVRATYTAPRVVTNTMSDGADTRASVWTGNGGSTTWSDCANWEQGKVPTSTSTVVIPDNGDYRPVVTGNVTIAKLVVENGRGETAPEITVNGRLTVTGTASCAGAKAYVCGDGTISLGTADNVEVCSDEPEPEPEPENPTAVDEEKEINISVWPNPAKDYVSVTSPYSINDYVRIYDMAGRIVASEYMDATIITFDISALAPGTYIVKAANEAEMVVVN